MRLFSSKEILSRLSKQSSSQFLSSSSRALPRQGVARTSSQSASSLPKQNLGSRSFSTGAQEAKSGFKSAWSSRTLVGLAGAIAGAAGYIYVSKPEDKQALWQQIKNLSQQENPEKAENDLLKMLQGLVKDDPEAAVNLMRAATAGKEGESVREAVVVRFCDGDDMRGSTKTDTHSQGVKQNKLRGQIIILLYPWLAAGGRVMPLYVDSHGDYHFIAVHNKRKDGEKLVLRDAEGFMHPKPRPGKFPYESEMHSDYRDNAEEEIVKRKLQKEEITTEKMEEIYAKHYQLQLKAGVKVGKPELPDINLKDTALREFHEELRNSELDDVIDQEQLKLCDTCLGEDGFVPTITANYYFTTKGRPKFTPDGVEIDRIVDVSTKEVSVVLDDKGALSFTSTGVDINTGSVIASHILPDRYAQFFGGAIKKAWEDDIRIVSKGRFPTAESLTRHVDDILVSSIKDPRELAKMQASLKSPAEELLAQGINVERAGESLALHPSYIEYRKKLKAVAQLYADHRGIPIEPLREILAGDAALTVDDSEQFKPPGR